MKWGGLRREPDLDSWTTAIRALPWEQCDQSELQALFEAMHKAQTGIPPDLEERSLRLIIEEKPDNQEALQRLFAVLQMQDKPVPLELEEQALRLILDNRPGDQDALDRLFQVMRAQGKNIPEELETRALVRLGSLHPYLSREDVFRTVYLAVEYVFDSGVEGHIAEFGTMTGRTAEVLAKAMATFGQRLAYSDEAHGIAARKLMLFDRFEGLPNAHTATDRDAPHVRSGVWGQGTCLGLGPDELLHVCSRYLPQDRIQIFKGWFSETLPRLPEGLKFALVHIDSDLYESAPDVLNWLFEKDAWADGCVLLFDDWDCNRASPGFGERKAWSEIVERFQRRFSDCGGYGFASHRLILHR